MSGFLISSRVGVISFAFSQAAEGDFFTAKIISSFDGTSIEQTVNSSSDVIVDGLKIFLSLFMSLIVSQRS